jgi:PAS domain S-box-containing protein
MGFVETGGKELVLGTGFDITERKAAEQALRESEEKFRRLAETIPVATFIAQGTRLCFTNSAMEQVFGYTSAELADKQFWEIVHPDYRDSVRERGLARQRGQELAAQFEVKFITKCGETRWGLCTADMIEYDGAPAVIGTITDITERKVAEDALRASEEKFRTLAETVPAAITIVQGTRFRFVNSAAEAISGYTRDELANLDFWETIHPDHRQLIMERGLARQEGKEPPSQYEATPEQEREDAGDSSHGVIEYEGARDRQHDDRHHGAQG